MVRTERIEYGRDGFEFGWNGENGVEHRGNGISDGVAVMSGFCGLEGMRFVR
jgi:hypothetical protein